MVALQGTGVSPGIASGKLYYFRRNSNEVAEYVVTDTENELERLKISL